MTVTEAITLLTLKLSAPNKMLQPLSLLGEVGLGYLRLGQPVNVLSGGESQRLKLVGHLTENSRASRHALLIFDEPTSGLHFDDIPPLLAVFNQLVERGNSILVIEHNLEVIQAADYVIDLGPEAGVSGGLLVAEGTPEQVAQVTSSHTGAFLHERLAGRTRGTLVGRVAEQRAIITHPGISVVGARHHNLKNLSIELPREQMIVITGLSGSGKSSLAFDILFAEGQRRFLDSMSTYARQFVEQMERPDVDHVEGLPPSVAIEQRLTSGGGKSTVATVTEVYHFLRLLFAKLGTQYCPKCDVAVTKQSQSAITKQVKERLQQGPVSLLAPVIKARKGFHKEVAIWAAREGYTHLVIDQQRHAVTDFPKLERFREHSIEVVIADLRKTDVPRIAELVKDALRVGNGSAFLTTKKGVRTVLSSEMACPSCGRAFEELDPRLFSFNSPHGWCDHCHGCGYMLPFSAEDSRAESVLEAELNAERRSDWIDEAEKRPCPTCKGSRLNEVARAVRVRGQTLAELSDYSVKLALNKLARFKFSGPEKAIADTILSEIMQRLFFMQRVGLEYLALCRAANTLSGGESQRIRLAAQLGSNLRGVLYVLDEPTIGLHPRDNLRLLETLTALRNKGNSLVVVEHDEETMRRADHIIDLGPRAGIHGGEVVATGTLREIEKNPNSETARCLKTPLCHPIQGARRGLPGVEKWIEIRRARANNLKGIDVRFPVGRLSVITGISGSGKSTLMHEVIWPAVRAQLEEKKRVRDGDLFKLVGGAEEIEAVYEVDQSPIGKTSRSTPGTYIKVFDEIRNLYAQLPVSRVRGYSASRFSFNAEGGRCESCKGQGVIKLEMNFLPEALVPCEDCGGRRYNPQTLEVLYNEKSIGDVMEMTLEEAAEFFRAHPKIARPLSLLVETGLGYLKLGQPSPTLSGGEAQRLKLVTQLKRGVGRAENERIRKMRKPGSTLYLLEEPTIGLHMADIDLLLKVLHRLVDEGNTVIVIEHNLSVIAEADYIVDLGPEAGDAGGEVVAFGTPEQVAKNRISRTAPFLRKVLNTSRPKAVLSS